MAKKEEQTAGPARVQVFELTMDNAEDQDDLNRHLVKHGEPNKGPSAMPGYKDQSTTDPADKSHQTNG